MPSGPKPLVRPQVCPAGSRRRLKQGIVRIYRPKRKQARRFTPTDLRRVFRYVACDHGTEAALCAVVQEADLSGQVEDALAQIQAISDLIAALEETESPVDYLVNVMAVIAAKAADVIKVIKRKRFLRWVLKRLFMLEVLLSTLETVGDLKNIIEFVAKFILKATPLLEKCACPEVKNASNQTDQ